LGANKKSGGNEDRDKEQFQQRPKILERAANAQISEMKKGNNPDNGKGKQHGRAKSEDAVEIFAERHRGERYRGRESHGSRNKARHETEGGMINLREKMIFAAGTRQRRAQFAIAERAAKGGDSADHPQHQQGKTGVNVRQLKSEARKDARSDDVRNHNPAGREKADVS